MADIFSVIRNKSPADIRRYIEQNIHDVNFQGADGTTPLNLAAQHDGNAEVAEVLISMGAKVNAKDKYGYTPLLTASLRNHIDIDFVKVLVSHGADVNVKEVEYGISSLDAAASNGNFEVVKYLVSEKAIVNINDHSGFTPLHGAAMNGNMEIAKYLVSKGADVTIKSKPNERGESFTPLELAKAAGKTDVVQYLFGIPGNFTEHSLDKSFIEILKKIVDKHGKGPLLDADKCSAFLADYAKRDYKEERSLFLKAVEAGVSREMIMPSDNRISCMKQQRRKLQEEFKLDPAESLYAVDVMAQIFWGCTYNID